MAVYGKDGMKHVGTEEFLVKDFCCFDMCYLCVYYVL